MRRPIAMMLMLAVAVATGGVLAAEDGIEWLSYKQAEKLQQEQPDRPILVFCKYRFCGSCSKMEREAFADPATIERIERDFIPARITLLGLGDFKFKQLLEDGKPLQIGSTPTLLVVQGDRFTRATGLMDAAELQTFLDEALAPGARSAP